MSEIWTHAKDWVPVAVFLVSGGVAFQKLRGGLKHMCDKVSKLDGRIKETEDDLEQLKTDGHFVRPKECAALHKGIDEKLNLIHEAQTETNKLILRHITNHGSSNNSD